MGFVATNKLQTNSRLCLLLWLMIMSLAGNDAWAEETNIFTDASFNPKEVTAYGDAKLVSGGASAGDGIYASFDGNGDYLSIPHSDKFTFDKNFTVEAWVKANSFGGTDRLIVEKGAKYGTNYAHWGIYLLTNGKLGGWLGKSQLAASGVSVVSTTVVSPGTWYHVAFVRTDNIVKLFINGVQEGGDVNVNVTPLDSSVTGVFIGQTSGNSQTAFNGNIDDLRITKDVARYKNNFVPKPVLAIDPTSVDPYWKNVSLLFSANGADQSTFIRDESPSSRTSSLVNGAYISTAQSVSGGSSMYFDGSNDYLLAPASSDFNLSSGDWTIEFWIYPKVLGSNPHFLQVGSDLGNRTTIAYWSGAVQVRAPSGATIGSMSGLTTNSWHHIAVSHSAGVTSGFVDGVFKASSSMSHAGGNGNTLAVATQQFSPLGSDYFNGYIDDVRFTKGKARYTSTFSLSDIAKYPTREGDVYAQSTSLFLKGEELNPNGNFTDSSPSPKILTKAGDTSLSLAEHKVGQGALYFDGNGDYLAIPNHSDFQFGSGDFTIEAWVRPTALPAGTFPSIIAQRKSYTNNLAFSLNFNVNGGTLDFNWSNNGTTPLYISAPYTFSLNTWYHVAAVRTGSTVAIYINGQQIKTGDISGSLFSSPENVKVGAFDDPWSGSFFSGYMDNLRVTKGVARYKSNFSLDDVIKEQSVDVDPTSSRVSLLLNGNGATGSTTVVDASYSPKVITSYGNVAIDSANKKYGAGAIKFDGNGDYLSIADTPDLGLGTDDYTIEMWINPTVAPAQGVSISLLDSRLSMGYAPFTVSIYGNTSGTTLGFFAGNNGAHVTTSSPTISTGVWTHVAWVRKSGVVSLYVNGAPCVLSDGNAANAGAVNFGASLPLKIGIAADSSSGAYNGYIDDLRITKGVARYVTNFNPPTSELKVADYPADLFSNNVELLLMSNKSAFSVRPQITTTNLSPLTAAAIEAIDVQFNTDIDQASFGANDVLVKNSSQTVFPVSSIEKLSSKLYRLHFSPALSDGQYSVTIGPDILTPQGIALDQNGNGVTGEIQDVYTYNFAIDTQAPPAVTINTSSAVTGSSTFTFTGTKEAGSKVMNAGSQIVAASAATTWSYTASLQLGQNNFSFVAVDAAGNTSTPTPATITYQLMNPSPVSLTATGTGSGTEGSLSWLGYLDLESGDSITSFKIYYSQNAFTNVVNATLYGEVASTVRTATLSNLERNKTYYVSVVAVTSHGMSLQAVTPTTISTVDNKAPTGFGGLVVKPLLNSLQLQWTAADISLDDFANYKLVYTLNGATQTILLSRQDVGGPTAAYELTGLTPATAYDIKLSAVDLTGNATAAQTNPGITLLPNPVNVQVEPLDKSAQITWNAAAPYALIKHYAMYVQTTAFTSVEGLTPAKIVAKGSASQPSLAAPITGLTNGSKVYVAVTTVNNSLGEIKEVQSYAVTPQQDKTGPTITAVNYVNGAQSLPLSGATLTLSGKFTVAATDQSNMSRVVLTLDSEPANNLFVTSAAGLYELSQDIIALTDGAHHLSVDAYDQVENLTHQDYDFTVDAAAPSTPAFTLPASGSITNLSSVNLSGTSAAGSKVSITNDDSPVTEVTADLSGKFLVAVQLHEGANKFKAKAKYEGRSKWSAETAAHTVSLNTSIPNTPTGLVATTGKQGQIFLSWNPVVSNDVNNQVKGYNLYRSSSPFTAKTDAGVAKVNSQLITGNTMTDVTAVDATYYYAVVAVNQVSSESVLSSVVNAVSDSLGPKIVQLSYVSNGQYDAATYRYGIGSVQVTATFSEPLRNTPYFAVVPNKGVPITIDLSKSYNDEKQYTGSFQISESTLSGTAYAVMSAYDNAGNRGTDLEQGASLLIDTQGPDVSTLTVTPVEPMKVDSVSGLDVQVSIQLNDETAMAAAPKFVPVLAGVPVAGYEQGIALSYSPLSLPGAPVWSGTLHLPNTAAKNAAEALSFTHEAQDDLHNLSHKIFGKNSFQVYQGELPSLATPSDLKAKALAGGKVKLTWEPVDKAVSYTLYRQGPNDSSLQLLKETSAKEWVDETLEDGAYFYAITSVRNENGQQSQSAKSASVSVKADRVAPAAPQQLTLEINGAGLVSRWVAPTQDQQGNPEGQGLSYNLYRLNLAQGQQASQTTNLTPIQTAIPALIALDTTPSATEHSYFVTAVDAAGNESAPSQTKYLNFGLLPVNQLHVVLNENGYPTLTWQHSGNGIKKYRVSRSEPNLPAVLLTPEAINHTATQTSYTDITYNGAQASKGASQEVSYSVVAVDNNDVESIAHTLTLPALSVTLEQTKEVALERGVMNQLMFRINNAGATAANHIKLYVSLNENGTTRVHQSEYVDVPAKASLLVPVVIGGYNKLDGVEELALLLEQKPQTNESVAIYQSQSVVVGNSSLTASLQTQDFTRGATGKASFTITNTSDVETELVLATNHGNSDSNELRLVLEDLQGNVLAQQPIKQFTGGVIDLSSGEMVARIAPKQTFTSAQFVMQVPAAAPDQVKLKLVVDKYHYQLGKDTHVAINGVGVSKDVVLSDTPYYAEITSITPQVVYTKGETVTIKGRALDRNTQQPLANVPVSIIYSIRSFERKQTVYTTDNGEFVFNYSSDGSTGKYRISAVHPDVTDRPNQGEFIVEGGSVNPQEIDVKIPRNYVQNIPVKISSGYDSVLSSVHLVLIGSNTNEVAQLPQGITVNHAQITNIGASSSGSINVQFSGDNTAAETGIVSYRVEADNHVGANALGVVNIRYNLKQATPAVTTKPAYIDSGVGLDQQTTEDISITNNGLDVLRNASVTLATVDASALPAWLEFNSSPLLGDVAVGESRSVQVLIKPSATVAEGDYEFKLQVKGDNLSTYSLPIFIKVTQSGRGKAFFHISDIYTATLDTNNQIIAGVNKASIQLQNENVLSEVYQLNTDNKGEALFDNIPAGRYSYRATAFDHGSISGRVWIKPGVTTSEQVFLLNNLINVEWSVREITVEDRYEVKLEATFKTNVPVAVVLLNPLSVNLPVMKKGEVFQGELTLTNHGSIKAEDVKQTLPASSSLVRFEFLKEPPTTLAPGEVFVLPYRIQALADFNPEADAAASGGGCGSMGASYKVDSKSRCVNETVVPSTTQTGFNSNWGNCGGGGGSTSDPARTAYGYSGGNGGGGGGVTYTQVGKSVTQEEKPWCVVQTECEECDKNSGSGK